MNIEKAFRSFSGSLETIYEKREAGNISRIVFEELFGITNFQRQDELSHENLTRLSEISRRLLKHEPIQYVLGFTYFFGLKLRVDDRVLIPRPETEELVHRILEMCGRDAGKPLRVLDIGTGSGCIPIALKHMRPEWMVEALDVSQGALNLARANAASNNTEIIFFPLDVLNESWWNRLTEYDLIVSNPPYIPEKEKSIVPQNVAEFEPHTALFVSDADPLIFYWKIARLAFLKLKSGGKLFFEVNEFNAARAMEVVEKQGFKNTELMKDLNGKDRMIYVEK